MNEFTKQENIRLLWDILLDEFKITNNKTHLVSQIQIILNKNIQPFISRANPKYSLMELNKQFLTQLVMEVNNLLSNSATEPNINIKRINITNEEVIEPYKIEDIHAVRQTDFEKELTKKKMDLENYLNTPKPKELNFSDNNTDGKITAMESLVAEKMAERELELLQSANYNTNQINPETWLTSQETSLKETKRVPTIPKKVSWEEETPISIFKKLKKTDLNQNITLDIEEIDASLTNKKYEQQQSIALPKAEPRQVLPDPFNTSSTNTSSFNTPILSQSEFVKQLNTMNTKIDNLYELVNKLSDLLVASLNHSEKTDLN